MVTAVPSPFDNKLQALADDARRAENARARLRRADRTLVDGLSGTFVGALTELAETQAPVTVLTRTESAIRGTIAVLGSDAIVVQSDKSASDVLLRTSSIEGLLECGAGHNRTIASVADRPSFAELLDRYAADRTRFAVTLRSGNRVMGTIARLGQDQVLLALDGSGDTMTIPTWAIDQVMAAS